MSRQPRNSPHPRPAALVSGLFLLCLLVFAGCASTRPPAAPARFHFAEDTFAFHNEMHWVYEFDETGNWQTRHRDPPPTYALRCFPIVRAVREFAYHARFQPEAPREDPGFYAARVREIMARSSQEVASPEDRVVLPGFANLKEFSAEYPDLLREECGTPVASYLQRGNWRAVLPFTRWGQARVARSLQEKLTRGELPIIHLTEFPMLNHGVLVYGMHEAEGVLYFHTYDPNTPETPVVLRYYPPNRRFVLPYTPYFYGGDVNVYEVYNGWFF